MNEMKFYLLMNHNHTSHHGAGCPVVFSDQHQPRAHTQTLPLRKVMPLFNTLPAIWRALRERIARLQRPQFAQPGEQFRRDALEL